MFVGLGAGPYRPIRPVLAQLQGWRARSQQQRLSVWQAGTWDLCCNVCTWTNVSSNNIIQRNCKGLNVTACMHNSGKFWTKIQKVQKKNPTAASGELGVKTRFQSPRTEEPGGLQSVGSQSRTWLSKKKKTKQPGCIGTKSKVLCMPPGLNTNKEVSKTPKPPLWPDLWTTPTLTPYKKPALLTSGSEQGNCYLFSLPTTVTGLLSICVD